MPVLQYIPVVEILFGNRSHDAGSSALFVFIRPTILRDDKFKDLKFLSEHDANVEDARAVPHERTPVDALAMPSTAANIFARE